MSSLKNRCRVAFLSSELARATPCANSTWVMTETATSSPGGSRANFSQGLPRISAFTLCRNQ